MRAAVVAVVMTACGFSVSLLAVGNSPLVQIDSPVSGASVLGLVTFAGDALENVGLSAGSIGAVTLRVSNDGDGTVAFSVPVTTGLTRTDVCSTYSASGQCPNVGWSAQWNAATGTDASGNPYLPRMETIRLWRRQRIPAVRIQWRK